MTAKGNPTFWGFEGPRVLLQGSLGSAYRLDTDSAAMHNFQDADGNRITYGSVLVPIAENQDAPSQRGFVVLGELNGFLWVQHLAKSDPRGAFPLPVPLSQSLVAANVAAVLGVPQEDVAYVDTDHGPISLLRSALSDYDVEPQKPYFLSLFDSLVEFRGVLFHVPWVSILDAKGRRTAGDSLRPLPGCWDADVLRSLYGLCDAPIIGNQSSYTQSPRTTPRSASAPAYRVTVAGRTAVCKGSFGHSLEADISPAALKPFGLHHGDRVMVLRGPDSGKTALIVGVSKGTLIVLLEGDSKVTLVRGCTNAQEVSQQFAVGRPAAASATTTSTPHSTPAKKESATPLPSSIVPALKTPKQQQQTSASSRDGGSMGLSPRSRGTPMFRCWTAFGRVEFDISSDRVSHFGPFEHEDSVRCTRGSSAGVTMTIVGERNGILWAVEKGKVRATPLAHCTNAAELAAMYGLEPIGKTSLRHLAEITVEPPPTPLGSPRGGLEKRGRSVEEGTPQASPRHDEVSSSSSPSAGSSSQLPRAAVVLPPIRNFPTSSSSSDPSHHNSAARPLMEELEPPVSARGPSSSSPRGAAAAASSSTEASPLRAASESSRSLAAAPFSGNPADGTPSGASARNYLKAVAMFMLGTSNANRVPLPFFVYYSVDTTKRLSAALKRFDTTKAAWEHSEKSKEIPRLFSEASTEDILRFLAKNPHLLPQI